jgi:hypothetical protein
MPLHGGRWVFMIMDETTANHISELVLRACECLNESVILVQERCATEEFRRYRRAVGAVLAEVNDQLLNPLYSDHPTLEPKAPDITE